jgi:transposase
MHVNGKSERELELERLLEEANRKIASQGEMLKRQDEQYSRLEARFFRLQKRFNKLVLEKENKNHVIKVSNHNKYYSKRETALRLENEEDESSPINEAEANLSRKRRGRGKGGKNFAGLDLERLAKEVITYDVIDEYRGKGYSLRRVGEDVSYLIKVEKEIRVIKVIAPKYVRDDVKDGKIYQAAKDGPFPHSVCTPSLAADIINAKYNLDVPLYRYSKYLISQGIALSDMDLTNYVKRSDELLLPLYSRIRSSLINETSNVIHSDETPLEVLDYMKGGGKRKNGHVFAYVSSYYKEPICLYDFNKTRETKPTERMLDGFKGYLVSDGYAGYDKIASEDIKIQRCYARIRRKFYDIVKVLPDGLKAQSAAYEMVRRIDRLFAKEREFVANGNTPDEIYNLRHEAGYAKIVDDIYDYLHSINAEDNTPLGGAVKYFRNLEEESKTFLLDGHVPISNNICERAVKPFAIMRRNVLFAKSEAGANIAGRMFTIVQTARSNGLVVDKYLEYVLENIGKTDIADLLPWSDKLPKELSIFSKKA